MCFVSSLYIVVRSGHALYYFLPILRRLLGSLSVHSEQTSVCTLPHLFQHRQGLDSAWARSSQARVSFPTVFHPGVWVPHSSSKLGEVSTHLQPVAVALHMLCGFQVLGSPLIVPITHEALCFIPKGLPIHPGSHSVNLQAM